MAICSNRVTQPNRYWRLPKPIFEIVEEVKWEHPSGGFVEIGLHNRITTQFAETNLTSMCQVPTVDFLIVVPRIIGRWPFLLKLYNHNKTFKVNLLNIVCHYAVSIKSSLYNFYSKETNSKSILSCLQGLAGKNGSRLVYCLVATTTSHDPKCRPTATELVHLEKVSICSAKHNWIL